MVVTESYSHCVITILSYTQLCNMPCNFVCILYTLHICISLGHLQSRLLDLHLHHGWTWLVLLITVFPAKCLANILDVQEISIICMNK